MLRVVLFKLDIQTSLRKLLLRHLVLHLVAAIQEFDKTRDLLGPSIHVPIIEVYIYIYRGPLFSKTPIRDVHNTCHTDFAHRQAHC